MNERYIKKGIIENDYNICSLVIKFIDLKYENQDDIIWNHFHFEVLKLCCGC